jgi:hypothetical protein
MASYPKFLQFGNAMNPNVKNPLDQSNPLTYCLIPSYNSQFLHGSTSSNLLYTPSGPGCMNYMSERCSIVYDGYCRAYKDLNTDTSWPNLGCIDNLSFNLAKTFQRINTTTGQNMVRNAAERRFIVYPGIVMTAEPFDPNVANSPIVSRYLNSYKPGPVGFKNLNDPSKVDNDDLIHEMCTHWQACLDILTKIYKGWKEQNPDIKIYPSRFQLFLESKAGVFEEFMEYLRNIPFYQNAVTVSDYSPGLMPCYTDLGKGF